MTDAEDDRAAAARLMTAPAVRQRAAQVLAAAEGNRLTHFALDLDRIDEAAAYVADVVRERYPGLVVPLHSRWRHFSVGGRDRWQGIHDRLDSATTFEAGRTRLDLAVISALLDAGAGTEWRYVEPDSGEVYSRSEGLAVASIDLFTSGLLSSGADAPFRVNPDALAALTEQDLATAFQVTAENPLVGLKSRTHLLHRLAHVIRERSDLFGGDGGREARLGSLFDRLVACAEDGSIRASEILNVVLEGLGQLWPGRLELGGVNLGDTWRHPAVHADDPSNGFVPFHKLSQWLTYSLIEPLEEAGVTVIGLDDLTGLAEYRNGGLFVDLDVLQPKHKAVTAEAHTIDSEIVVEWRALTVALLDRIADPLRRNLGVDAEAFPLAKVLEGGTWQAGRRIAEGRREGGAPPIQVLSDGTVF